MSRKELSKKFKVPEDAIDALERFGTGIRPERGSGKWMRAHGEEIQKLIDLELVTRSSDPQKISGSLKILSDKGKKIYQARSRFYNKALYKLIDDPDAEIPAEVLKDFPRIKKTAKNLR